MIPIIKIDIRPQNILNTRDSGYGKPSHTELSKV